jgi:gamma-glutamylcyclotransferase
MNCDQWYFAYGSNLLVDQKEKRTGRVRQPVRSRLKGYRFAFNKRGDIGQIYANIVPDDNAEVWGVAYLCNPEAIRSMDRYEGVASGHYERIQVVVEKDMGETAQAITYVAGEDFFWSAMAGLTESFASVCEPFRWTFAKQLFNFGCRRF